MMTRMNCDQVFDILTRGPFPSGASTDASVERHLMVCHECRQLAEALRPAVALFHESVPSHELDDLPGYNGVLCETEFDNGVVTAVTLAERPLAVRSDRWPRLQALAMSRVAAGAVLTVSIVALVWSLFGPLPGRDRWSELAGNFSGVNADPPSLAHRIALKLDGFNMSERCYPDGPWGDAYGRQNGMTARQCCSACHRVASQVSLNHVSLVSIDRRSQDLTNAIVRTCSLCHSAGLEP